MSTATLAGASLSPAQRAYQRDLLSPWKLNLYFLKNLPSALWWGLRVRAISAEQAEVTIPFNWRTQNPFRSIYFAALAGAGELATGVLANLHRLDQPSHSMLVIDFRAEFVKKAVGTITFTCTDGAKVRQTIARAMKSGQGETVEMCSVGRNSDGEVVARVFITWSFKRRQPKA